MKTKIFLLAVFLGSTSIAHEILTPEVELQFILKRNKQFKKLGSKAAFDSKTKVVYTDSKIDYEQIQQSNPLLTKDKVHEILNSIDADKVQINKIEEPPHKFVVEIKEPKHIRFYFDRKQSKRPSPHTPQYHEEWDYFLIGIKEVQPAH